MQWVDNSATTRVRMFPLEEFIRIARGEKRIGVSLSVLCMLQDDTVLPGSSATGQLYLQPDLTSLRRNTGLSPSAAASATIMTFWRSEDDHPVEGCPRSMLRDITSLLKTKHGKEVLCGFEIEVVFLKADVNQTTGKKTYLPATTNHSWSQMTTDTKRMVPLLEEITQSLKEIGISIEQFHAESAPGQFEFVLPPASPLAAVDALYTARQVVASIADLHGFRATMHPRPFADGAGSASHAHISISPSTNEDSFLAGILHHYRSITAFTLAQEPSYERVRPGIWSGSEWVTWGFQNREAPVRKVDTGHWEYKSMDGLANPYLAVSAILAGGYLGLEGKMGLGIKECKGMTDIF